MPTVTLLRDTKGRFIKGVIPSTAFKKGHIPWDKGQKFSKEYCNKLSMAKKGKYVGETNPFFGKKHTEESLRKISDASKKSLSNKPHPMLGKHHSEESKEKNRKSHKGKTTWMKGKHHTDETKEKLRQLSLGKEFSEETREKISKSRLRQILPIKDTTIEIMIQEELKKRNINYIKHQPFGFWQVDIMIPDEKIIIECDGDYWHNRPERRMRDKRLNGYVQKCGWNIYHLWESKIRESASECIDKIFGGI